MGVGNRELHLVTYCVVAAGAFSKMGQRVAAPHTTWVSVAPSAGAEVRERVGILCACVYSRTAGSARCAFLGHIVFLIKKAVSIVPSYINCIGTNFKTSVIVAQAVG